MTTEAELAANRVFEFIITTSGGKIVVEPFEPGAGKFPGGHARIKKLGSGFRKLIWTAAQAFTIEFAELGSDTGAAGGGVDQLFEAHDDVPLENPAGTWVYKGDLRGRSAGSSPETVAYKYTVKITGFPDLDPLIVVDR
jgi:hypothetical protein